MKRVLLLLLLFSFAGSRPASALVNYDKGSRAVLGRPTTTCPSFHGSR